MSARALTLLRQNGGLARLIASLRQLITASRLIAEWAVLAASAGLLALATFWTSFAALIFLLLSIMVIASVRLGVAGSLTMIALVLPQAIGATVQMRGPLMLFPDATEALLVFVLGCIAITVPIALLIRRARQQVDARAEFLASMSHDIRTPMTGVLGFTDLLQQGDLTPEQRRNVDHIAESGQTMVRLLNDILDFSQLEAGRMELSRGEVDLHAELAYAAALFRPRAHAQGLTLDCVVEPHVPHWVYGDALRIRQVLLNIVGNAVKFTDSGHVRLSAHAHRGIMASELVIEVEDTGIGIAPEALGRIFEKYGQAGAAMAGNRAGNGLGLAISRQLVALMDGRIGVTSRPGKGTCFTVHLPVQEIAAPNMPKARDIVPLRRETLIAAG